MDEKGCAREATWRTMRRAYLEALRRVEHRGHPVGQPLLVEPDVDETRSGEAGLRDQRVGRQVGDDRLSYGARILRGTFNALHPAEQRHSVVALVVSVSRIVARGHQHVEIRA